MVRILRGIGCGFVLGNFVVFFNKIFVIWAVRRGVFFS